MKATGFEESNKVLEAGDNPNTDQLPVSFALHKDTGDAPIIFSKFRLSEEEIERIIKEKHIWIGVMGQTMPPIMPTVQHPFKDLGYRKADECPICKEQLNYIEAVKTVYCSNNNCSYRRTL